MRIYKLPLLISVRKLLAESNQLINLPLLNDLLHFFVFMVMMMKQLFYSNTWTDFIQVIIFRLQLNHILPTNSNPCY